MTGLGGGTSVVNRVSTVRSSGSYVSPSVHSGLSGRGISTSIGYGGFGNASSGSSGVGLGFGGGGAVGYTSSVSYGGGHSGGFFSGIGYGGGSGAFAGDVVGGFREKETMQCLNDRLASYLTKVHSLEQDNQKLERNIREWHEKQVPYTSPDLQHWFLDIGDLQKKILNAKIENASILLQIDNARLAADDFRTKLEHETYLRMSVESDINGLRRVLDELNLAKNDCEMQLQTLNDELAYLKKNHAEEVSGLKAQLGARINVEVNAAPSSDLTRVLSDVREKYEALIDKNRKDAETWFVNKSEELNQQVTTNTQQIQTSHTEVIELRHTCQNLEIELQTQNSLKTALENTLAETEMRYCNQLAQIQALINDVEAKLADMRGDMERQNSEYRNLLDIKTRLEGEIMTYRRLLDGEENQRGSWHIRDSMLMGSGSGSSGGTSYTSTTGSSGGMGYSGTSKPRTVVEDVNEGFSQSKRE